MFWLALTIVFHLALLTSLVVNHLIESVLFCRHLRQSPRQQKPIHCRVHICQHPHRLQEQHKKQQTHNQTWFVFLFCSNFKKFFNILISKCLGIIINQQWIGINDESWSCCRSKLATRWPFALDCSRHNCDRCGCVVVDGHCVLSDAQTNSLVCQATTCQ